MIIISALFLATSLLLLDDAQCFTISRSITTSLDRTANSPTALCVSSTFLPDGGVTSALISNLAELALKLRLKGQTGVKCDVSANSSDLLLRGRVGPVTVKGRGWQSELGLSCRVIEATVDTCELDVGRILSNRKLVLTSPAQGQAMIALNAVDFANFISHPYVRPPVLPNDDGKAKFAFLKEGCVVDSATGKVTFFASYMDKRWRLTLSRGSKEKRAIVVASLEGSSDMYPEHDATCVQISNAISNFFNDLKFELDGTWLSFRDMMVTAKGGSPHLMLQLSITVKKFPSRGLAF